MKDILIIFIVLLVLLIVISTLGGSIRYMKSGTMPWEKNNNTPRSLKKQDRSDTNYGNKSEVEAFRDDMSESGAHDEDDEDDDVEVDDGGGERKEHFEESRLRTKDERMADMEVEEEEEDEEEGDEDKLGPEGFESGEGKQEEEEEGDDEEDAIEMVNADEDDVVDANSAKSTGKKAGIEPFDQGAQGYARV